MVIIIVTVYFDYVSKEMDRLCGLVVRVPGYRSRGPGSIPGGFGLGNRYYGRRGSAALTTRHPSIRKS
jgi:hypothetical protein